MRALPALLLAVLAGPAPAQEEIGEAALDYAWSNSLYTLYHEVGHMLVDQLGLPVLAREEDAADNLATLMLLEDSGGTEDKVLTDAATGWALSEAWGDEGELTDDWFYDEHSLDQQRAFAMVCLLVGSDPDAFGATADEWGMDEDRQEGCAFDYGQAATSWEAVLEPWRRGEGDDAEGMVTVLYDPPDEGFEEVAAYLEAWGILEVAASRVDDAFLLPAPVTFQAAQCGEDNAYYDPSEATVTLCYEHAQGHAERWLAADAEGLLEEVEE